jgi:hypothetical protein
MPDQTAEERFATWAILELMGHRRLAGHVQEVQIAGAGFLRLDIPPAGDDPGRTQYVSPASVYAMHPTTEDTARRAAAEWRPAPVQPWELRDHEQSAARAEITADIRGGDGSDDEEDDDDGPF